MCCVCLMRKGVLYYCTHTCSTLSPKPPLCLPFCTTMRHHAGHTVATHEEENSFSERGANKGPAGRRAEVGGKHHATWEQGRPKHKPSMLRHCVACAELAVEALSKGGGGGPALTMVHEAVVAQAHTKRHRLLPRLAVPLKRSRRGCSEGSQH